MKRLVYIFLLLALSLHAQKLKVEAEHFEADESKGESVFSGNVKITMGSDELNASKVIISIDKERKPVRYDAVGGVSFRISADKNMTYSGKAEEAIFMPKRKIYRFLGSVEIFEGSNGKKIIGEEVNVNLEKGSAVAKGSENKPVIMIFDIDEAQ